MVEWFWGLGGLNDAFGICSLHSEPKRGFSLSDDNFSGRGTASRSRTPRSGTWPSA